MKVGDLVLVYDTWFEPGESDLAVYMGEPLHALEWRDIPYVDCTILLNGKLVHFSRDNLVLVGEEWEI